MPIDSIIISPWSRGKNNAKHYPYMQELCDILAPDYKLLQVGVGAEVKLSNCKHCFDMNLGGLEALLKEVGYFIAVDNFFHHMAHYLNVPGIVIWGPSDSAIFGYKDQVNITKDFSLLRKDQFGFYKDDYKWEHSASGWHDAKTIASEVKNATK